MMDYACFGGDVAESRLTHPFCACGLCEIEIESEIEIVIEFESADVVIWSVACVGPGIELVVC